MKASDGGASAKSCCYICTPQRPEHRLWVACALLPACAAEGGSARPRRPPTRRSDLRPRLDNVDFAVGADNALDVLRAAQRRLNCGAHLDDVAHDLKSGEEMGVRYVGMVDNCWIAMERAATQGGPQRTFRLKPASAVMGSSL